MKKIKIMAAVALLAVSTGTSAQFTNSNTSATGKITTSNSNGWNTLNVQYNPSSIKIDSESDYDEDFTAYTLEWTQAQSISSSAPLFVEYGLGVQYGFNSDEKDLYDTSFSTLFVHVPINLIYDFQIPNSPITFDPFVGIKLRCNILAQKKYTFKNKNIDGSKTLDYFDKDDWEKIGGYKVGDNKTWSRLSIGWQIGLNARFNNKFMIGVSYGSDLNEIAKKTKIGQTSIKLGMVF